MEGSEGSPVPQRAVLQKWVDEVAERIEAEEVSSRELAVELAHVRRAARDLGWVADYLLVAAREQGAKLPMLGAAWSRSGQAVNVRGPDQRLKKLRDRIGDAATVRRYVLALPADELPERLRGQ